MTIIEQDKLNHICGQMIEILDEISDPRYLTLSSIYEKLCVDKRFKSVFATPTDFSRYLRKIQSEKELEKRIPNLDVDTSNHIKYTWKFYPSIALGGERRQEYGIPN